MKRVHVVVSCKIIETGFDKLIAMSLTKKVFKAIVVFPDQDFGLQPLLDFFLTLN